MDGISCKPWLIVVAYMAVTIAVYMLGLAILLMMPEPDALFWQTAGIYTVLGVFCGLLIGRRVSLPRLIAGGGCAYLIICLVGEDLSAWLRQHIVQDMDSILFVYITTRQRLVIAFFLCAALLAAACVRLQRRNRSAA